MPIPFTLRSTNTNNSHSQQGFSLIEVLVALTVTVIGVMGLLTMHVSAIRGNQYISKAAEANVIAKGTFERLRGQTIDEIEARFSPLPIVDWVMNPVSGHAGQVYRRQLNVAVSPLSTELIWFQIDVMWTDEGATPGSNGGIHDHTISLETVKTRGETL